MMLLLIHEVLAGAIFYSVFCRSVRTCSNSTRLDVIAGFWVLGAASIMMMAAPIVSGWMPSWPGLLFMASVVTVQWVTSKYWCDGVPVHFRKPSNENVIGLEPDSCSVPGQAADGRQVGCSLRR